MKKIFTVAFAIFFFFCSFAQWQVSLTMKSNETIRDISAPTDDIIWAVTGNFIIYYTSNGGSDWNRVKAKGLADNISITKLYAVNAATAFLSANTDFTGVGPGIVYKTTDKGQHWNEVFTHKGNCNILIGMFNNNKGLMTCSFDSFNGSVPASESLYSTIDGGNTWKKDTLNPARSHVMSLEIRNNQAGMADYNNFYYSAHHGDVWHTSKPFPDNSEGKKYLQFEDSSYAVISSGNIIDLLVKRPHKAAWVDLHMPPGITNGAVTGIVLDGNECWLSEAFDTNKLFYSSDSLKTFTSTIPDVKTGFQFLTKARNGRTLVGGTPSFMQGKILLNKRTAELQEKSFPGIQKNIPEAIQ